jgi:hypothetical protein
VDDAGTYPSPTLLNPTYATGKWAIGVQPNVDDAQLAGVAEGIERLIQQDFATGYFTTWVVPAANGSSAITVSITVSGGVVTLFQIGTQSSLPLIEAAGIADAIRLLPGKGVRWVPA